MEDMKKMLYLLQKFQILTLYTNSSAEQSVTGSYAYAWSEGLYPILNESADWHEPYKNIFSIGEEQLSELHNFLCEKWDAKAPISFYALERHYGIDGSPSPGPIWSRNGLVKACRYFYLHDLFDKEFWSTLLENGKCPSEAHCIAREIDSSHIYFE